MHDLSHCIIVCSLGRRPCRYESTCIASNLECNGKRDCRHGLDEMFCDVTGKNYVVQLTQLKNSTLTLLSITGTSYEDFTLTLLVYIYPVGHLIREQYINSIKCTFPQSCTSYEDSSSTLLVYISSVMYLLRGQYRNYISVYFLSSAPPTRTVP